MKERLIAALAAVGSLALIGVGPALARNPNCAGGIQYIVQAMADKQKNNKPDYEREMAKAVQRLEMCSTEDSLDYEAQAYLGWAYAEVDSCALAGTAFTKAIAGLQAKGDKKKVEWAITNRESYWVAAFNQGIAKVNTAQGQESKEASRAVYGEAIACFNKARLIKPDDPRTLRNLGTTYALMGDYATAEPYFREALVATPEDTSLVQMLRDTRTNRASQLIQEQKFDQAIAFYKELLQADAKDADSWAGLGEAYASRADSMKGDARKADSKSAAEAYAKAASIRSNNPDLTFNAALSFRNAGDFSQSAAYWRKTIELRPDDRHAPGELVSALLELKKYDEAIAAAQRNLGSDPKDKDRHYLLGVAYTKAGNNPKSTEAMMTYLALQKGSAVADARPTAISGPAGKPVMASNGAAEEIYLWEADGQKYETWFYWTKGLAFHFTAGLQSVKSDWSAALQAAGAK